MKKAQISKITKKETDKMKMKVRVMFLGSVVLLIYLGVCYAGIPIEDSNGKIIGIIPPGSTLEEAESRLESIQNQESQVDGDVSGNTTQPRRPGARPDNPLVKSELKQANYWANEASKYKEGTAMYKYCQSRMDLYSARAEDLQEGGIKPEHLLKNNPGIDMDKFWRSYNSAYKETYKHAIANHKSHADAWKAAREAAVAAGNAAIKSDAEESIATLKKLEGEAIKGDLQPPTYYPLTTKNGSDKYKRAYTALAKANALQDRNSQYYSDTKLYFKNYVLDKTITDSKKINQMWQKYIEDRIKLAAEIRKGLSQDERRALDEELKKVFPAQ